MKKEEIASINQSLKQYTGTKTIFATPMTRGEYHKLRGWHTPENEDPDDNGYLVQYVSCGRSNLEELGGYISWFPQAAFEDAYRLSGSEKDKIFIRIEQLFDELTQVQNRLRDPDNDIEMTRLLSAQMNVIQAYHQILAMRYEELNK